ncbi:PREDICTED: uncharacterized protein LOC101379491 [Odobenus rosmarus divergens]
MQAHSLVRICGQEASSFCRTCGHCSKMVPGAQAGNYTQHPDCWSRGGDLLEAGLPPHHHLDKRVVESRKPAQPVKIGPPLIPAEVQSYRRRPSRVGDFSLNSGGLEKRATHGARDPAGVSPAPAQPSQRQASPRPAWAPPHSGPAPNSAACISHEPLRLPHFGKEVAFCTRAAVKRRIAAGSSCWAQAGGGTSAPSGVRQAGGGSAAGAGRVAASPPSSLPFLWMLAAAAQPALHALQQGPFETQVPPCLIPALCFPSLDGTLSSRPNRLGSPCASASGACKDILFKTEICLPALVLCPGSAKGIPHHANRISSSLLPEHCLRLLKSAFVKLFSFQNKNRVAILAELDKEKRKLLMQNQSSTNHPGASIALSRPSLNKDFRDHAEQQHIAAQQKAALQHAHAHSSGYFITQDSAFGNLILPVLPRLDPE